MKIVLNLIIIKKDNFFFFCVLLINAIKYLNLEKSSVLYQKYCASVSPFIQITTRMTFILTQATSSNVRKICCIDQLFILFIYLEFDFNNSIMTVKEQKSSIPLFKNKSLLFHFNIILTPTTMCPFFSNLKLWFLHKKKKKKYRDKL